MSTDKFDISDIAGSSPNPHGKAKFLQGRSSLNTHDIEYCQPKQLKQNNDTNIPDYKLNAGDICKPRAFKFSTNRVSNPLSPSYEMQTSSRRHVLLLESPQESKPRRRVPLRSKRLNAEQIQEYKMPFSGAGQTSKHKASFSALEHGLAQPARLDQDSQEIKVTLPPIKSPQHLISLRHIPDLYDSPIKSPTVHKAPMKSMNIIEMEEPSPHNHYQYD